MARNKLFNNECSCTRRDFMRKGLYGVGITASLPLILHRSSMALAAEALLRDSETNPNRIMVVLEFAGGNDGLNTIVPYGRDEYYRARPTIGIARENVLKIDDELGFNDQLQGFHQLYEDGHVAVVNGTGYPNPNLSHFSSMEYWHTGVPHGADDRGWVGRIADAIQPEARKNFIVNVSSEMSLAVRSGVHAPIVFNDPDRFQRLGTAEQMKTFDEFAETAPGSDNATLDFLHGISANAAASSVLVREAAANYNTPIDYGPATGGGIGENLRKIAALIDAGFPTRFYYMNHGGFDTHVNQSSTHRLLMMYSADAIRGFMEDMERIGRADDVAIMIFSEFGRRVEQNAGGGTDHGTAGPMFIIGKGVKGGLYGKHPSLSDLDENGNMKMTTDFRRVYATMIKEWMGYDDTKKLLKGEFKTLGAFA